jgi:hypothetical protein
MPEPGAENFEMRLICSQGELVFSLGSAHPGRTQEAGMVLRFGDHVLDIERRELRRGAEPVALEPQVFDLLVYPVRNRGRVGNKDDLIPQCVGRADRLGLTLTSRLNAKRSMTVAPSSTSFAPHCAEACDLSAGPAKIANRLQEALKSLLPQTRREPPELQCRPGQGQHCNMTRQSLGPQ